MFSVDHFVLPVSSLELRQHDLEKLGFTLAPKAIHPFGTANICLYLGGDVFVEFLSQEDGAHYQNALHHGNLFVRLLDSWCHKNGNEGFCAVAFFSQDAFLDYVYFIGESVRAGPIVEFFRIFSLPDGSSDRAGFCLAFAQIAGALDLFFFACQRVAVPKIDRSILECHENGVAGLKKTVLCVDNPSAYCEVLSKILNGAPFLVDDTVVCFDLPNAALYVMRPSDIKVQYGVDIAGRSDLSLVGLVMLNHDMAACVKYLSQRAIAFEMRPVGIMIQPFMPSSVFFAFEEP